MNSDRWNFQKVSFVLFISLIIGSDSYCQIGKKFREKTRKVSSSLQNPTQFLADEGITALKKSKAKFDSSSFGFAISLSDNAGLYENKENLSDVRDGILLVFDNSDKAPIDVANNYKDAGEMAYAANEFKYAGTSFELSRIAFEVNDLTDHVNYAGVIADQGLLNHTMGRFMKSQDYTTEALDLRKTMFGENSMAYAVSLNNLSVLQKDLGEFTASQNTIDNALSILVELDKSETLPYAIMMNNKAMLYKQLGRYTEADNFLRTSVEISADLQGSKSTTHQRLLTNQAILYQEMQKFMASEEIFLEVIDIKESRLGKRHPDYAHMLNNLAALYVLMGKDGEVEELLSTASEIYEKKFGTNHPSYASSVANLGKFYLYMDRTDEAGNLLKEALDIRRSVLGESHPDYARSLEDLAIYYWKIERWQDASTHFEMALDQSLEFVESFFPAMSEEEKSKYWTKIQPRSFQYFAFAAQAFDHDPAVTQKLLQYRIATKGILLSSTLKIRASILGSGDASLILEYLDWIDAKETLAGYYTFSKEEISEQGINLDSIKSVANNKERFLSENSAAFREGLFKNVTSLDDLKNALNTEDVAVEIIQIPVYDRILTGESMYYALVIKKEKTDPELIKLGTSTELDDKYYKYYKNSIRLKSKDDFSYEKFFLPLAASLAGKKVVYLSADGIYNQVNLKTLQSGNGFVMDNWEFVLLTNIGDLPSNKSSEMEQSAKNVWLLGNPAYGESTSILPLPGTKNEVESINDILSAAGIQTTVNLGENASEETVKEIKGQPICHFATHGFFLADPEGLEQEQLFGIEPEIAQENPMLRAGIMLAGAAKTFHGLNDKELLQQNNGILTAYEAMNLNLDKTELVVLSACETGLGDVKSGEGVYGLQRAFLVAGADRIIMSLWKVSDEATSELMTSFYKNLISHEYDIHKAFSNAQLALKEKYPEPYYWGAFVLIEK